MTVGRNDWRERMKEKHRAEQKKRRAALAADPRVQAMKEALKKRQHDAREKAKARRREIVDDRKARARAEAIAERAERAAELRAKIQPATRTTQGHRWRRPAPTSPASRVSRACVNFWGELHDLTIKPVLRSPVTIGEQAEARRQRERFVELGVEVCRALARAARTG